MSEHEEETTIGRLRQLDPARASAASEMIQRQAIKDQALRRLHEGERDEGVGEDDLGRAGAADRRRRWRPTGPLALGLGGTLAAATGIAALLLLLGGSSVGPGSDPQFAEAAIRIAETSPRLLMGEPGWSVSYAEQFEIDEGQIDFRNGHVKLSIDWEPADHYVAPDLAKLRRGPHGPLGSRTNPCVFPGCGPPPPMHFEKTTVLGREGLLTSTPSESTFTLDLPPQNGTVVDIHARDPSHGLTKDDFLEIIDSIQSVDVDTWLAALPRKIVRPVDHRAAVDGMLEGLPVPDGVDVEALRSSDLAMDRYHLGARVSGAIACGWLDQWAEAVKSDDAEAREQAAQALATSHDWPILKEMAPEGGWSQTVWEYSHDVQVDDRDHLLGPAGTTSYADGTTYEDYPGYAVGLGCDSERHRLVESHRSHPRKAHAEAKGNQRPRPRGVPHLVR